LNLEKKYKALGIKELVEIVESPDYTEEARNVAMKELESRNPLPKSLIKLSQEYFKEYFENQLGGTLLTNMNDINFPRSEYLSKDELKEIISHIYNELRSRRDDFYKNLPS